MKKLLLLLCLLLAVTTISNAQTAACTAAVTSAGTPLATGLTTLTYTDTTVVDGQSYDYMVTAVDPFGYACSNITTNAAIPSTGTHTVVLTWVASTTSGVTYSVFRAQTPTPPSTLAVVVD
jgi:hypothetical protein